jgi:hypothetical protein
MSILRVLVWHMGNGPAREHVVVVVVVVVVVIVIMVAVGNRE